VRLFIVLFVVLLFTPFENKADVACQYDCLAKGGLPEICDSKCGVSRTVSRSSQEQEGDEEGDSPRKAKKQVEKYRGDYDYDYEEKGEVSKGGGSSASGGGNTYFTCIKECRDAGNKLQDCRSLCSED
jgi:hypothetical protein